MNEPYKCIFCEEERAELVPTDGGYFEETNVKWGAVFGVYFAATDKPTVTCTVCPKCRKKSITELMVAVITGQVAEFAKAEKHRKDIIARL